MLTLAGFLWRATPEVLQTQKVFFPPILNVLFSINLQCLWVGLQNFTYQLSSRHHFTVSLCLLSLLMFLASVFADYFPPPEIVEDRGLARPVVAGIVATICFLAAAILFSTMAACFVNKQRRRKLKRKRGWWLDCSSGSPRFIVNSVLLSPGVLSYPQKEFYEILLLWKWCIYLWNPIWSQLKTDLKSYFLFLIYFSPFSQTLPFPSPTVEKVWKLRK